MVARWLVRGPDACRIDAGTDQVLTHGSGALTGNFDPEQGEDADYTIRNFGANAGMFVYF